MTTKLRIRLMQNDDPQYKVAAECGIDPATLSQYAQGNKTMKPEHLKRLARYFKCPPKDLIGEAQL